jgi:hypothetical protein
MDKNLDANFEEIWKQYYEKYIQDFEIGKKKARNIQAYIDHSEGQIRLDFPGSAYVNYYIKDVIYYFYHLYNIGSPVSEILDKVIQVRKEHLVKFSENPQPYERSSDGFNLKIEDQSAIINFLAHHYAKKQFLKFLENEKNRKAETELTGISSGAEVDIENPDDNKKQRPTNAQKLLALYYLQKVKLFPVLLDILPLSEFISFLTGQNQKNTYDQLREIDDYKKTRKNLVVVRKQFERLGMDDVLKLIDNDLKDCWK